MSDKAAKHCPICPHECLLPEGITGICGARTLIDGKVVDVSYGQVTSLALDPIEKKPFACYRQGSMILSVGSYGCNLDCPFCQNHEIASPDVRCSISRQFISPQQLIDQALSEREQGNIGIAYTYNEPFIAWEYMRDCSELAHENGLINVAVTNGYVQPVIWEKSLSLIDAFNIDLKCFSNEGYRRVGAPDGLEVVKEAISTAVASDAHVEITTLIVPGLSDDEEMFERECDWIASLDVNIPLHITRFFPAFKMSDRAATDRELLYRLQDIAEKRLKQVFLGNI